MRLKRFLCALAAALLCLSLPVTAYAGGIMPMYEDDIKANAYIAVSGDTADCTCKADDYSFETSSISVVMTLQKSGLLGYTDVKDVKWTETTSGSSISLNGSKSGLSGGTYRVKAIFTVTAKDGGTSTITKYSGTAKVTGT